MERWQRLDSDLIAGVVLLVLCAAIAPVVVALPSDGVVAGAPGSRLFPLGLLSILAGLSAVLALGGLRRTLAGRARVLAGPDGAAGTTSALDRVALRVGVTVGALIVYVYLMAGMRGWLRGLGILVPRGYAFTALTAVFLTGFYFLGSRRLGRSALIAAGFALALYVGFVAVLNVRFP